ncbi:MAG: glycosyltransferase family 4 protein, partial [Verrucomicrobiae bacterium]|nr:glycosyltransferase family 4 protein [Verrucomicrobiae bacterium]
IEPWRTRAWETLRDRARDVDLWVSPSRYFADRMSERLGLDPARLCIVPNGIRLDGYDALPERQRKAPGDAVTLGFFARMCADKGLDLVVDAFLALRAGGRHSNLRMRVGGGCGPGDQAYVDGLRRRLNAAGLEASASFHPNLSREDKIAFYAACDVISVPSRMSESFGLYLIESLAAGTPLVQPDVSGFGEVLRDTGGGVLYARNTSAALASALEPLLADPAQLALLGAAGKEAVWSRYSDTAMARNTVSALDLAGLRLPEPVS